MSTTHKRIAALLAIALRRDDPGAGNTRALRHHHRYRKHGGGAAPAALADPANTTYVSDSFNRSDRHLNGDPPEVGPAGATWSDSTDNARILSNRSRAANAAARRMWVVDSNAAGAYHDAADGKIRLTLAITGSSGIVARWADNANCLYLQASGLGITLYRIAAGALTAIGSASDVPLSGDELRLDLAGSALAVYLNGGLEFAATETQGQSLTTHGIGTDDISSRLDNYSHRNY